MLLNFPKDVNPVFSSHMKNNTKFLKTIPSDGTESWSMVPKMTQQVSKDHTK